MFAEKKDNRLKKGEIRLEKATLSLLSEDILKICIHENVDVDREDLVELQQEKTRLLDGSAYYSLVIAPRFGNVTKEAREFSATPAANEGALGKAVVIQNLGMKLIIRFFIAVNKPPVPHQVFSTEADALGWIERLREARRAGSNLS